MRGGPLFRGIKHTAVLLAACLAMAGPALAVDVVTTEKDADGWKLKVNGKDFFVKGVVWGYTPRNQNYNYNLWGKEDEFIRKVLDYEFGAMQAAGVNAIRSFNIMPPKWVNYVYDNYGIMVVINPLVGRYGYLIDGRYVEFTDYSDARTREILKRDTLEIIEQYKNVRGVLMFALGNESNYGLSWKSFEIENLPVGEQQPTKARYLYSLFQEIMVEAKKIAPNHPVTFINGDLQYIDLISEVNEDLDLLGVNAYRGKSFTSLWDEVDKKLDVPVLFFEFGADAFNARTGKEDQINQALILKEQWREMYNKAAGNGEEGNAIGGFVFEWRDEWWKYLQEENLDVQDNNASWANGGYPHDFVDGQNNMNEEWWGITALGDVNEDGIYTARPRMAVDVLAEAWRLDPYTYKKAAFNDGFSDMNLDYYELKAEVRQLKETSEERKKLEVTGGSFKFEGALKGEEVDIDTFGDDGDDFTDGQMAFIDFGFAPTKELEGQFTINVLANVADLEPIEIAYGRRGFPLSVPAFRPLPGEEDDVVIPTDLNDRERVEIYDFGANYEGKNVDIEVFYHTPRYHWKYEGDFFGLVREATDIEGSDIWNAKAPEGVEFASKNATKEEGLKFVIGPEIYWGANPKAVLKYSSFLGKTLPWLGDGILGKTNYTVLLSEDFDRQGEGASGTAATQRETRAGTLYTKTTFAEDLSLELGAIISATERRGEEYDRLENVVRDDDGEIIAGDVVIDEIDSSDTLGFKAKLNFPVGNALAYASYHYAGLVAEGGDQLREFSTRMPYSALGNKKEFEAGALIPVGNWWIFPRVMVRENLVDANPNIDAVVDPGGGTLFPGIAVRDRDSDPFAVLDNREANAAELFITYDPTGATNFYQWDNDWREDARIAWNVGATYIEYPTATDSYQFFFEPTGTNPAFGVGLPAEDVWEISNRIVYNPNERWRIITNLQRGFLQPTGDPEGGTRKFWEFDYNVIFRDKHIVQGFYRKDAFGPYDFQRQFNITFPEQYKIEYRYLMDQKKDVRTSSQIGIRGIYRTLDENSGFDSFLDEDNEYQWQIVAFYIMNFGGTNPPLPRN